jgi:hypothetical protein
MCHQSEPSSKHKLPSINPPPPNNLIRRKRQLVTEPSPAQPSLINAQFVTPYPHLYHDQHPHTHTRNGAPGSSPATATQASNRRNALGIAEVLGLFLTDVALDRAEIRVGQFLERDADCVRPVT